MFHGKIAAASAACALLVLGSLAVRSGAAEPADVNTSDSAFNQRQPLTLDEAPPGNPAANAPESILTNGLNSIGVGKWLKDWGIKIGGSAEGSYTYNMRAPASKINEGRVFDFEHDAIGTIVRWPLKVFYGSLHGVISL